MCKFSDVRRSISHQLCRDRCFGSLCAAAAILLRLLLPLRVYGDVVRLWWNDLPFSLCQHSKFQVLRYQSLTGCAEAAGLGTSALLRQSCWGCSCPWGSMEMWYICGGTT